MILKFINREKELEALERAYRSRKAEFFIIYGRRRTGKTELAKRFAMNKKHFYFLAKQQPLGLEFTRFKEKFSKRFNVFIDASNWEELFTQIKEKTKGRLIIIIDEFPFWIVKDKAILSEFQYIWDEILSNSNIFLILLGSYVGMMEQDVMGYKSPLYGRRTGQICLHGLSIWHIKKFLPGYSMEDIIKTFGALDTIPYYLVQFKRDLSFNKNILETFLNKTNPLYQDAEILLSMELREPNTYFNIIKSILDGSTKLGEIASKSMVDVTNLPKYLNVLIKLKLIEKIRPLTFSTKTRKHIYVLKDNYFRFWLTYVYPYREEIEESPEEHLKFIMKDYNRYLGPVFEEVAKRCVPALGFSKIGKWWHKDKEIDIVGINEKTKQILFAECKWRDNVNPEPILKELYEKKDYVKWNNEKRKENFAIFAKSFRRKINNFEGKKVQCFDLKDIAYMLKKQTIKAQRNS